MSGKAILTSAIIAVAAVAVANRVMPQIMQGNG